jgi:hypothetical protein
VKRYCALPAAVRAGLVAAFLGISAMAASAPAGGGNVLPSNAKPKGYSLADAAAATAVFDTGPHDATPPKLPFYTLVNDATVKPGTMLYVPIFHVDDSGEDAGKLPADVTDQQADADYLMDFVKDAFNVDALIIVVDGEVTVLDDSNIHGLNTAPLLDGPPAGTNYIVSGAFVSPLSKGDHTIGIGGIIDGEPVVFVTNNVTIGK